MLPGLGGGVVSQHRPTLNQHTTRLTDMRWVNYASLKSKGTKKRADKSRRDIHLLLLHLLMVVMPAGAGPQTCPFPALAMLG